jgi:hypothetical protein
MGDLNETLEVLRSLRGQTASPVFRDVLDDAIRRLTPADDGLTDSIHHEGEACGRCGNPTGGPFCSHLNAQGATDAR